MATRTSPASAASTASELEPAAIARLFKETSESQAQLLRNSIEEIRDILDVVKVTQQTFNDLLQVLTNQSEMAEKQSQRLVTVTHALIQATTALKALPPGSARVRSEP